MNNYHIYEVVGRGKHSTIYKGRKKKTLVYYAIKSVDKQQRPRVLQEVRTMHALQHSNILRFYAWYETTNHLWLILEFCVGGDLTSLLAKDKRLPEDAVHDFGRDMFTALQHLHHKGIIYCDLKPSNILLDENGRIKLGGFGLSRRLADINQQPVNSLPPAKRGTPCYMAPELFDEGATHSTASDLWAAGCVLYECLTGDPPFVRRTLAQLMSAILHEEPAPLGQGVSEECRDLVMRLLDKNPLTRITWEQVVQHPFWQAPLDDSVAIPPEPAFQRFLDQHYRTQKQEEDEKGGGDEEEEGGGADKAPHSMRASAVDVIRLSLIAKHNLDAELIGGGGGGGGGGGTADEAHGDGDPTGDPTGDTRDTQQQQVYGGSDIVTAVGVGDDVQLNTTDAEIDFEEKEQGDCKDAHMSQDSDNNNTMHTTNHHQRTGPTGAPGPAGPLVDEPHSPMRAPLRNTPVHDMPTPLHPQQHARRASTQYQQQQPQPQQQQQQSVETTETQYHNATSGKPSNTTGRVPSTKTAGGIPSNRIPSTTITTGGIPAANTGQQQAASSAAAPGVSSAMSSTSGAVPPTGASGIGGAAVGGGTGGTSGIGIAGSPGVAVTGVASCMWHPSDAVVRPIVANSRIERPVTPSWEAAALPCAALTRRQLVTLERRELTTVLTSMSRCLQQGATTASQTRVKTNLLAYIEHLCGDGACANTLLSSHLPTQLLTMLRVKPDPPSLQLHIHAAAILGLMVRHALVVPDTLASAGLLGVLHQGLQCTTHDRLRRGYAATFGEVLFYMASQAGKLGTAWKLPESTLVTLCDVLLHSGDAIVQHYILKTIENIASQSTPWTTLITTNDMLTVLCTLWLDAAGDEATNPSTSAATAVQIAAASTLSRLLRWSPGAVGHVMHMLGAATVIDGLQSQHTKLQIASLNVACCVLAQLPPTPPTPPSPTTSNTTTAPPHAPPHDDPFVLASLQESLYAEGAFGGALWPLLSHESPAVRGKAAVAVVLMGRRHVTWWVDTCSSKAFSSLEKLSRDADPYIQQIMTSAAEELSLTTGHLVYMVQQGITGHLGHVHPNSIIGPASLLLVLLHYLSSPWLRPHCITHHLLQQLATLLDGLVNGLVNGQRSTLAVESASQALEVLLHVVEALFQQPDVLQRWFGVALTQLLPALALCTSQLWDGQLWDDHGATPQHPHMPAKAAGIVRNEEGVMAAKLLCDLLLVLLWEPRCCNYAIQQDGEGDHHELSQDSDQQGQANALMNTAIAQHILPLLPPLLHHQDPLPLYALRMVGALLPLAPHWAPAISQLGLVPLFFQFLSVDSPHNNVHNLRVCTQLVLLGCASPMLLRQQQAVPKVVSVLRYALENSVEPFMEPLFELAIALLTLERLEQDAALEGGVTGDVGRHTQGGVGTEGMAGVVVDVLAVCGQGDVVWSRLAVEVVSLFAEAHPREAAGVLLQGPVLRMLGDALQEEYNDAEVSLEVKHHLLTAVAACLAAADDQQVQVYREVFADMEDVLQEVAAATSGPLTQLATELLHLVL